MKYNIETTIELNPTIRDLAELIWELDCIDQAELVEELMLIDEKWRVESQIYEVVRGLNENGIEFFKTFSDCLKEVKNNE